MTDYRAVRDSIFNCPSENRDIADEKGGGMKNVKAFLFMIVFMLVFTSMAMGAEIHQAAKKGSLKDVKALVAKGEKVDVKDKHDMTPLYYAAVGGHKDVCEYLISKGADVNAKDNQGISPLAQALKNKHKDIAALLKKHGGVK